MSLALTTTHENSYFQRSIKIGQEPMNFVNQQ
jgi:hypothetical protein